MSTGWRASTPPFIALVAGVLALSATLVLSAAAQDADWRACNNVESNPEAGIAGCTRIIARGNVGTPRDRAIAFAHRGQAYQNRKDYDRAIADFTEAIAVDPEFPNWRYARGVQYGLKGNFDGAIADFSEAIRLNPKAAGYFSMRGVVYEKQGRLDDALSDFRAALALDSSNREAANGVKRVEPKLVEAKRAEPKRVEPKRVEPKRVEPKSAESKSAESKRVSPGAVAPQAALTAPPQPAAPTSAPARVADPEVRVALLIGNGAYVNANKLPNAANDARAVAGALRQVGFDVSIGTDLDRAAMERLVRDFLRKAATARVALLFYAGHGMQVDGKNYLVPVDAKLAAPSDLSFDTVEVDKVLDALNDPGRTNLIILDACRDNPLARAFASRLPPTRSAAVSSGLAAYSTLGTGTLIAYATAPGQVALDGEGANSPFTTALIHHIRTPGLEVRQMLTRVRADVAAATGNKQIPWDNSSLLGDVFLMR